MNKPILRALRAAVTGLLFTALTAGAADEISEALDASIAAQRASKESQARVDKLDDEARALQEKRKAAQWKSMQLSAYADQLEKEAATEEQKRGELRAQLARIASTGTDLLPLMRRMVAELDTLVAGDLPFLQQARRQRINDLKALLDDPQKGNADKFRRVMEAYRTEVDYGQSLGAEDVEMECGGTRGKATLIRVGRVGLYCLTEDGKQGGYWDAQKNTWQVLDDDLDELKKALVVARGTGAPELLVLPVRAAEPAK